MMIDVTVADVDLNLTQIYTHMNPLVAGATVLSHNKNRVVFEAGTDQFVISGADLLWRGDALIGGSVAALTFRSNGVDVATFADLQSTGPALWSAFTAERAGTDPAALINLLVQHCWTYHGSTGVDYFPETTLAPFGALNPTGNDRVWLNGGDDVFFTGAAQDTVLGGAGCDEIAGGSQNDRLNGGADDDSLFGGSEDDTLMGGRGIDLLSGGGGLDTLSGGAGDDRLRGGDGADVFVFAAGSGRDMLLDYVVGVDHLQIAPGDPMTIEDRGANIALHFGLDRVLLLGVTMGQLSEADFL